MFTITCQAVGCFMNTRIIVQYKFSIAVMIYIFLIDFWQGKVSRMLAAKCAMASRYDALADESSTALGVDQLARIEKRLQFIESGKSKGISKVGRSYKGDSWTNQAEVEILLPLYLLLYN